MGGHAQVEDAIERTGTREQRWHWLPTHLVVTLVVGMELWAAESVRHVLAEVVAGWREVRERQADALAPCPSAGSLANRRTWRLPSTAAIVQVRQRVGRRLFRELFHAVAGPIAAAQTPAAFLGGLRLMAIDGTTLDVADTPENARLRPPNPRRGCTAAGRFRRCEWWRSSRPARTRGAIWSCAPSMEARRRPRATCCGRSDQARCCYGTAASIATS